MKVAHNCPEWQLDCAESSCCRVRRRSITSVPSGVLTFAVNPQK